MNLTTAAPAVTKPKAFALFEGSLLGQPEALEKVARLDGRELSDYIGHAADFYTALADAMDVVDAEPPAGDPDLATPAGKAYLRKLFDVLRTPAAA